MIELDIDSICRRIAVQSPYFGFRSLRQNKHGAIEGEFMPEQPLGHERGPVATAEVGRHLAILGSCAAACSHSDRIYYLATEAHYTQFRQPNAVRFGQPLWATAEVLEHDRRGLLAQAVLSDDAPFVHLRVRYLALSEAVFERLFHSHRLETDEHVGPSPYASLLPLAFDEPNDRSLTARGTLRPECCAGHFPEYPSWPVAIIGYNAVRVMERLLHYIAGNEAEYTIISASIASNKLVSAASPLLFRATCTSASKGLSHYAFSCLVLCGEEEVARFTIEMRL